MKKQLKHFELTTITKKNDYGVKLFRIVCTRPIKDVKIGDLGGWV